MKIFWSAQALCDLRAIRDFSRPFEPDLLPIVVGGDSHLAVLHLEFLDSKEGRILIPLLRRHKDKGI